MTQDGITVVIVSRGLEPMLELCLRHLVEALAFERSRNGDRIIVIDNASPRPYDSTLFEPYGAESIRFDVHRSFAACCNRGMRCSPNPFYLMLNNDVVLHPRAVAAMLRQMRATEAIAICGARLLFPNNTIQHCGIRFGAQGTVPYHWKRTVPAHLVTRENRAFQAVTAACMLLRHEIVAQLGGFDEDFAFAFEDLDLCLRARQNGWKVVCSDEVDSIHFESMTPGRFDMDRESGELFAQRWANRWAVDG